MAFKLTEAAKSASEKLNKKINIILEIDGIPFIYSAQDISQLVRIGMDGLLIGNFIIGGQFTPSSNKSYLSLKDGTSTSITQQIQEDKAVASSISTMKIALVDKNDEVSNALASNNYVTDILSKKANVYLGFQETSHPEDSIRIFSGNITNFDTSAGLVSLSISHPDNLKRQDLLQLIQTELTSAIDPVTDVIDVISTSGFNPSSGKLTSYIKIDDEIIRVGSIAASTFIDCERGAFNTTPSSHSDEAEVTSFYRLQGSPIDLLLDIYTSGEKLDDSGYLITKIENSTVWFDDFDIEETEGLTTDDIITISSLPYIIKDFEKGNGESAVVVVPDEGLPELPDDLNPTDLYGYFSSKYSTLNFGAGLSTSQIDIAQHETINTLFGSSFPEIDIYIKETLNLREFVENDILYPCGAISVPRKGRISLTYTAPPLATTDTKTLNYDNITNPDKITVKRNTNRKFYNTIEYKFDEYTLEERLLRNNILFDASSFNQIRVGSKSLKIEAKGFRKDAANFIDAQSRRFIDRYRLGAETYQIETTYGTGFNIEVGDIAIFDSNGLKIYDSKTGSRVTTESRLVEVTNKSLNATTGQVKLTLTDTAFSLDGRYGTIAPSSKIESGTTTEILLKTSYNSSEGLEYEKWEDYIGSPVHIYNSDFSVSEFSVITGFSSTNRNKAIINPPLSAAPTEDMIFSTAPYDESNELQKLLHPSLSPQVSVLTGISTTKFDVATSDIFKFFVGSILLVHKDDYSVIADEVEITDITGDTITVNESLGFIPDNTYNIDLIGFSDDNGLPYRYI